MKLREGDVERGVPITPKVGRLRFEAAIEDLLNDYRTNGKRSAKLIEQRVKKHLQPFFRGVRMAGITTADVRRYIAGRQDEKAANATVNRELAALKRAFTLAMQAGNLLARPHIPMLREDNARTGFFEWESFEEVRSRLSLPLKGVVTFMYVTGWRLREVLNLQWRNVDFGGGTVRLDPRAAKNGEGRVFPMTKELRGLLDGQKRLTEAQERARGIIVPYVFHRDGQRIRDFYGAWRTACDGAGVPGRFLHDFRRTAVRNLVRAGVPERVAMQMTGHKTRSVFERYNIVSEGDLCEAAHKIDVAWIATVSR